MFAPNFNFGESIIKPLYYGNQQGRAKCLQSVRVFVLLSAVARPNGQPRQAGVARGVRGHAPPPPEKF